MGTKETKLRLVVPVNFSRKSEMALDFALSFSRNSNADVYLLHVLEGGKDDFREMDRRNAEYMDRMQTMVMKAIERVQSQGISPHLEDIYRRIGSGKPANEILDMAAGINADMIVMGSPSSNWAKKLVSESPCTTVLVKPKDTE